MGFEVNGAFNKLRKTREIFWSGRPDLNRGPPAPKAGGLPKITVLFSTLLLKQNNLVVILACGWLCAYVPICLLGGHKSWHNRDGAPAAAVLVRYVLSTRFELIPSYSCSAPKDKFRSTPAFVFCQNIGM
jgi:hypothetical protein